MAAGVTVGVNTTTGAAASTAGPCAGATTASLGSQDALVVGGVHEGCAPDGAVDGPGDESAPGEYGQSDCAEGRADGNEDGSFRDVGLLHVGCVCGGWDGDYGDEVCGYSGG